MDLIPIGLRSLAKLPFVASPFLAHIESGVWQAPALTRPSPDLSSLAVSGLNNDNRFAPATLFESLRQLPTTLCSSPANLDNPRSPYDQTRLYDLSELFRLAEASAWPNLAVSFAELPSAASLREALRELSSSAMSFFRPPDGPVAQLLQDPKSLRLSGLQHPRMFSAAEIFPLVAERTPVYGKQATRPSSLGTILRQAVRALVNFARGGRQKRN